MTTIDDVYKYPNDSDLILKSNDNVLFYVSRMVLMSNSSVFQECLSNSEHMEEIPINYISYVVQSWLELFHSTRDRFVSCAKLDASIEHNSIGNIMLLINEYDMHWGPDVIDECVERLGDENITKIHNDVLINIFKYDFFECLRTDELCHELLHRHDKKNILRQESEIFHAIMRLFNVCSLIKPMKADWDTYKSPH